MNRFTTAALAALAMAIPLSAGAASAQTNRDVREARRDVREERRDLRDARRDLREARQDRRQAQRWNARQHNGYSYHGRWYYGEPTRQIMAHRSYEPGYRTWRRGDRLNAHHRSSYRAVDYRRERLRAPPRGYHYVRSDRGETLLVGIATGVILGVILSQ
jgi:Ni/Co efflux regulator RcnB